MTTDLMQHRLAETERLASEPNRVIAEALGVSLRSVERYRKRLALPAWGNRAPRPLTHGSAGYNRGCRCKVCSGVTAARNAAGQRDREARGLAPGDERHGSLNGYRNWGCRCKECRGANAVASAGRRLFADTGPVGGG